MDLPPPRRSLAAAKAERRGRRARGPGRERRRRRRRGRTGGGRSFPSPSPRAAPARREARPETRRTEVGVSHESEVGSRSRGFYCSSAISRISVYWSLGKVRGVVAVIVGESNRHLLAASASSTLGVLPPPSPLHAPRQLPRAPTLAATIGAAAPPARAGRSSEAPPPPESRGSRRSAVAGRRDERGPRREPNPPARRPRPRGDPEAAHAAPNARGVVAAGIRSTRRRAGRDFGAFFSRVAECSVISQLPVRTRAGRRGRRRQRGRWRRGRGGRSRRRRAGRRRARTRAVRHLTGRRRRGCPCGSREGRAVRVVVPPLGEEQDVARLREIGGERRFRGR